MEDLLVCLNRARFFKVTVAIVMYFCLPAYAQGAKKYVQGEVIVKLKSESQGFQAQSFLGKASQEKNMNLKRSWGRMNMYHFSGKAGQSVEQMIDELKDDPSVEYVEPNFLIEKASVIEEQGISLSTEEVAELSSGGSYLATSAPIQAQESWGVMSTPDAKPIVAVIDTGLKVDHRVFVQSNSVWTNTNEIPGNGIDDDGNGYVDDVNGWNFVSNSGYMHDDDGHGTHVAGIVLGVGQDIYSDPITEDSKILIMPLKFLDSNGVGKTSDAIQAIYYAVNNGASVLNNSWGGESYSAALHEAVAYSYSHGVAFVAAAGNSATNNDSLPMYPANYAVPHVMSIAATNDSDYLAYFSNFGVGSVHIGSPGQLILSTYNDGGYRSMSGTSMASPFVAGIAALMKVENSDLLGYQIKQIIFEQSNDVNQLHNKIYTESRVNVLNSVTAAKSTPAESSQPSYSFTNGDRELASALTNSGGCGTVAKLASSFNKNGRNGGSGPSGLQTWYVIILISIFAMPVIVARRMKANDPVQRRKHDRFMIDTGVKVNVGGKELSAQVSSISLGGVQVNTEELLEHGGILNMTISSPDGKEQIQVEGRVVWSEEKRAYGVQFNEAKETALDAISSWTKGLTKAN